MEPWGRNELVVVSKLVDRIEDGNIVGRLVAGWCWRLKGKMR